ncbi:MAG TPA: hypothetical protein VF282_07590 [Bacillota bacterium]
MDQLTQPELHMIEELLIAEELAIKKAHAYRDRLQDADLKRVVERCAEVHQAHFDDLLNQLHEFSGGLATRGGR